MTLIVRAVTDQDFDAIWDIFHRVVATGDTYAFSPNRPAVTVRASWGHFYEQYQVLLIIIYPKILLLLILIDFSSSQKHNLAAIVFNNY